MNTIPEIQSLIDSARFEYSLEKSNSYLREAVDITCEATKTPGFSGILCLLGKEAYKELALNCQRSSERAEFWNKALKALTWGNTLEQHLYASTYAELVVDIYQDPFSDIPTNKRFSLLKNAKELINNSITVSKDDDVKAICLIRKSAIIRIQAVGLPSSERLRLLSEAARCCSLARELIQNAAIILECALVEWALARLQNTDKKYVYRLKSAEEMLRLEAVQESDVGPFALTRFYRLTYRYYDACITYPQLSQCPVNRRRLLRESAIYAESAIQLYNLNYPKDFVEEHLENAQNLLEIAISSGCRTAREVIALAYIQSIRGGVSEGTTALQDLGSQNGTLAWGDVLKILCDANDVDLPAEGFALGVTDSASLTRLGTFSNRFLNDSELTEALFRAAVKSDPHDPIAQTNLARFLLKRGRPTDLIEAKRIVQLAQSFSDRRFTWWRPLLLELNNLEIEEGATTFPPPKAIIPKDLRPFSGSQNFRNIRQHYNRIKNLEDEQFRGYELERLIRALSLLSCSGGHGSYRMVRPLVNKIHQVDGVIEHRGKSYRYECKWQKK